MAKIAVTGAAGHLGCVLVRQLLAEGHAVRAIIRKTRKPLEGLGCETVVADIRKAESLQVAFEGVDVVFHFAAFISMRGKSQEKTLFDINVRGTQNVVDMAMKMGTKRLIHCSSIQAFDRRKSGHIITENSPRATDLHAAYDRSKVQADEIVNEAVGQGLDGLILHPTAVIGPHDYGPSRMGLLFVMLLLGRVPALIDAECDFVDVRDVARAAILAMKTGRAGEHYLLGGHLRTIRELALAIQDGSARRVPALDAPPWLARIAAPWFEVWGRIRGIRPVFTGESLDALFANHHISIEKAKRELEFIPRPFEETVRETCAWFTNQNMLLNTTLDAQGSDK